MLPETHVWYFTPDDANDNQPEGWYWMFVDLADEDPKGPFDSWKEADHASWQAAKAHEEMVNSFNND